LYPDSYYWVESAAVKNGLISKCKINDGRIFVVPNTCADIFRQANFQPHIFGNGRLRIAMIGAAYPHKNYIAIVPALSRLKRLSSETSVEVFTTLPEASGLLADLKNGLAKEGLGNCLVNLGPINMVQCRELYEMVDVVIQPSVLEAFSATYPEAICMNKPLIVSNQDFATSVCGEAALYFDPERPEEIADRIYELITSPEVEVRLSRNREVVSKSFLTNQQRFEMLFKHMEHICSRSPRVN
jgi:glycosyltransferase involved in cell wall biosynthesis